jgi:tRNA modification GTPase
MSHATAATIYALATAAGRAGVAVVRISGPAALAAVRFLGVEKPLAPRHATLVTLTHRGNTIDQALGLYFPAPHSFTGEDVVELHTHGSRAVMRLLLDALGQCDGLRMAQAGEFARRAFANGKLDLAQAEGLADLIDAQTASQHTQALRQLDGGMSRRVEDLRAAIIQPLALMEAYIDFPDEEIPEAVIAEANARVAALVTELEALLDDGAIGEKIRDGLDVVITGAPNVGKSSLLNVLVKRDAAIVSAEAGTTRDIIEVAMELGGYALTLVDTAGIREHAGSIEAEGIRRARTRAQHADIVLELRDASDRATQSKQPSENHNKIVVFTKSDLSPLPALPAGALAISTKTGDGLDGLMSALAEAVAQRMDTAASPLITRARHREALAEAAASLKRFRADAPLELVCEELRVAATAIGKITGKIWVDDVLDLVFSRFCIGK